MPVQAFKPLMENKELSGRKHFQAIEEPHRKMHEIGESLFKLNFENSNDAILAFNESFERVNKYLHLLETELLLEENARLSKEAKKPA